jgi:NAD(P)-dependent dehydrogenase (short-subunit alcohol dehydrogenase family)
MKNIVITGGSGGIGGAVAKTFLKHGWHVHLFLRSFENPEVQQMMKLPNVSVYKSDPGNKTALIEALTAMKNDNVHVDFVFHAAGTFLWDDGFPRQERSFEEVKQILFQSNVETKENLVAAIESVYRDSLSTIEQGFVGSHAGKFAPGGPERTGKFTQEGYVEPMALIEGMATMLRDSGRYKNIFLYEPGFINTGLMDAFTTERLGFAVDWSTVKTPDQYAEEIFPEPFFTARL